MRRLIAAAAAMLLLSPVLAQNASSTPQVEPNGQPAQPNGQTAAAPQTPTAQIAQQIRSNLEKAGFKNIKLMPSSFMVRATDQNNNPVMMVINPDSITEISESQNGSSNGTTGQSANGQPDMSSSSGNNQTKSPSGKP